MNAIRSTTTTLVAAALITSGCAGRKPNPIDAAQVGDEKMSCDMIAAESRTTAKRIIALKGEENNKVVQNIAAAAAGVVFILPFFLMDFQDAPGVEGRAMVRRQRRLQALAREKGCKIETLSPDERAIKRAQETGKAPRCSEVGGYETYMKKTGKVCML
jgi:hypothetical protein